MASLILLLVAAVAVVVVILRSTGVLHLPFAAVAPGVFIVGIALGIPLNQRESSPHIRTTSGRAGLASRSTSVNLLVFTVSAASLALATVTPPTAFRGVWATVSLATNLAGLTIALLTAAVTAAAVLGAPPAVVITTGGILRHGIFGRMSIPWQALGDMPTRVARVGSLTFLRITVKRPDLVTRSGFPPHVTAIGANAIFLSEAINWYAAHPARRPDIGTTNDSFVELYQTELRYA